MILRIRQTKRFLGFESVAERSYSVHFHHVATDGDFISHKTICSIHPTPCAKKERPCGTPGTLTGEAFCSVRDPFNKARGRKIAFGRAIESLPKPTRALLWNAYLNRKGERTSCASAQSQSG